MTMTRSSVQSAATLTLADEQKDTTGVTSSTLLLLPGQPAEKNASSHGYMITLCPPDKPPGRCHPFPWLPVRPRW